MTNIALQKQRRTLWYSIPGLALGAAITRVTLWGGSTPAVAGAGPSALAFTILLGMVLSNTIYPHIWKSCDSGVLFAKQYLLRLGIVPYGFRPTFSQTADVGISGVIIDASTLSNTFPLACFLGQKMFGSDKHTNWLIGTGSSICGAAAVLAAESVVKVEANKVTVVVATVAIFETVVTFLYPAIYPLMSRWFNLEALGTYIGSTTHKVAQVVAADHTINPDVENAAVISKMLRVTMLAPFLILLVACVKQLSGMNSGERNEIIIPWLVILFVAVAIFNSSHLLSQSMVNILVMLDTFLLAIAMAALGLTTHVSTLKKTGAKPLLMALVLSAWLIVGGGTINYVIQNVIA